MNRDVPHCYHRLTYGRQAMSMDSRCSHVLSVIRVTQRHGINSIQYIQHIHRIQRIQRQYRTKVEDCGTWDVGRGTGRTEKHTFI